MNLPAWINYELIGLVFLTFFLLLILSFAIYLRGRNWRSISESRLRNIPSFSKLMDSINFAVESGQRLHMSLGWGTIGGVYSTSTIAGLSMLRRISEMVSFSDKQPTATSGDGTIMILSQDTMHEIYRSSGCEERYDHLCGHISGLTPFSYAAGTLPIIYDQKLPANVLAGHFGVEAAMIADASENTNSQTLAGSDDLSTQSVMYATANDPLIGEELYAGGAYLQTNLMHVASLHAQDVVRWILVLIILTGIALKISGKF